MSQSRFLETVLLWSNAGRLELAANTNDNGLQINVACGWEGYVWVSVWDWWCLKSIYLLQTVHKKTFYYLEQLILKHKLHQNALNIKEVNGRSMTNDCIQIFLLCMTVYICLHLWRWFGNKLHWKVGNFSHSLLLLWGGAEHYNVLNVNYLVPDIKPCVRISGANQCMQLSWCAPQDMCRAANQRAVMRAGLPQPIPAMWIFMLLFRGPYCYITQTRFQWRLSRSPLGCD